MKKIIWLLILCPYLFSSCARKCCPDHFNWSRGKPAQSDTHYDLILCEGQKVYTLGGPTQSSFQVYDLQSKKWNTLPPTPIPVTSATGALINQSIYILGGIDSLPEPSSSFLQLFDLHQNQWTLIPELKSQRSQASAVVCRNKIYLIGGLIHERNTNDQNSSLLEEYDPVSKIWTRKHDMPTARHGLSAVTVDDKIIVAGGMTNDGGTNMVEIYDPLTDKWDRKADLPAPADFLCLVNIGNTVFAFGAKPYEGVSPILKYDVNADQWTQVSTMPFINHKFGIAVNGKYVYIIGGEENPQRIWEGKKG